MGKISSYIKLVKYLKEKSPLVSVQLNVTNTCACKCVMCYKYEWQLGGVDKNKIMRLISDFEKNQVESIVFSGGDPLVYPHLAEVIESVKTMKMGLLTAGNVKFKHWDQIVDKLTWLRFSVDAFDTEKWMEVRGSTAKSFGLLKENLDIVSQLIPEEEKKKKVRFNFCILKDTNEEQEEKVKDWANSYGFNFMAHDIRIFEQYMRKKQHHEFLNQKCIVPYIHCIIEADGEVYPCCDVMNENAKYEDVNKHYSLGNLNDFDYDFYALWSSKKAIEQKNFFYNTRVKECETCPVRYYPANVEYEEKKDEVMFL